MGFLKNLFTKKKKKLKVEKPKKEEAIKEKPKKEEAIKEKPKKVEKPKKPVFAPVSAKATVDKKAAADKEEKSKKKQAKKKEAKKGLKRWVLRKKPVEKKVKEVEKVKEEKPKTVKKAKPRTKVTDRPFLLLKEPHVTEKARDLAGKNQYVFKVKPKANKIEVKKVIEELYDVDVLKVRIVNVIKKRRRLGRIQGWRAGYKKAIIRVKQGQSIEVLPK